MAKTRSSSVVWLVGPVSSTLPSTKLPSGLEVLSVFFHHHMEEKQTVGDSARATADELLEIWSRARIPTRARNHVVEQVTKYHAEWKGLLKSRSRASAVPQQQAFVERAKELLDIAHRDALSLIKIEEAQREKGRRGRMAGVDLVLARKDERRMMKAVAEAERQGREKASSKGSSLPLPWCYPSCTLEESSHLHLEDGPSRRQTRSETTWNHLEEVAIFIVQLYAKYWFQAPSSVSAPRNDLHLLKVLEDFPSKEISTAATTVFSRHLWYLSETLVGFAFFDDQVTLEVKRKMVKNLKDKPGSKDAPKWIHPVNKPQNMDLSNFVTTSTKRFFNILHVNEDFLQKDPRVGC